jgi:glycolate oxidase FAD binding subunit
MAMETADTAEALAAQVREAFAGGRRLRIRGGGTKDWYGEPPAAGMMETTLDTRAHAGIVEYDPSELVVTARCGTPLAALEATLAASGQMLACEAPHFGAQATVGGCIAAGLSGPRRATAGSVRDFVLGAKLINGRGQHLSFGGQVIKNVAGYDVSRLLAGSLGILGVITEVSLKVVPLPVAEATLRFDGVTQDEAMERLNRWAGQPLPLSASAWTDGILHLRLSGARAAVRAARDTLGGDPLDPIEAAAFWTSLREQSAPFFAGDAPLWRLSLPSVAPPLPAFDAPTGPLIEWGGALRWLRTDAPAGVLREAAHAAGGHATLFRRGRGDRDSNSGAPRLDTKAGCFAPLDPALLRIHQRLKAEFDPAGVFNHGRLYPGL